MTHVWQPTPQFKIEVGTTTYTNDQAVSMEITRPESNISSAVFTLNDYRNKNYISVFDKFSTVTISLRYGSDAWIKVFCGRVHNCIPHLSAQGELLTVSCWGLERSLVKTLCDTSYGAESQRHPLILTPHQVLDDLIAGFINTYFGVAVTGYNMGATELDDPHADLSINYLNIPYLTNFDALMRLCDLVNAHAQAEGEVGVHWYVDPDEYMYFKKIDASWAHVGALAEDWTRYWKNSDPNSTLTVTKDMILYDFQTTVEDYSNDIIFSTAFRRPAEDVWTEPTEADGVEPATWEHSANATIEVDTAEKIVGSKSVLAQPTDDGWWAFEYPKAHNLDLDLTKISSPKTVGALNFYIKANMALGNASSQVRLYDSAGNYWSLYSATWTNAVPTNGTWAFLSFPVGPYHQAHIAGPEQLWVPSAATIWTHIDYIYFLIQGEGGGTNNKDVWIDDLHFSGNIVRRAFDSGDFAANYDQQLFIRNDTAVSDCLVADETTARLAAGTSGTAAALAYSELKRHMATPIVGVIAIPLAVDILPGQSIHIHACQKADGNYRIDSTDAATGPFRVKELKHYFGLGGATTILNLTNDVTNSHALGAPSIASLIQEHAGMMGMSEARDLKGGTIDNLLPRLEKDY